MKRSIWLPPPVLVLLLLAPTLGGEKELAHFEKRIRPVLVEHCYPCHSVNAKKLRGGLLLDSRWGWETGGESGPAIVPGKPEESLIVRALRYESFEMPPKARLPESIVADFVTWIEAGAPDPREKKTRPVSEEESFDLDARRAWWSLLPLRDVSPPSVEDRAWPRSDVDQFLLAGLEHKGWSPAPAAAPLSWLRRVTYDLTGLPPTAAEARQFLGASDEAAFEAVVDRLLDSPHFGEQWARHWMDLVRFAESKAFEADYLMANVSHYRDYLIRAFNADVPYDQLLREALAGDLLESPRLHPETGANESIIGPGFLYLTDGQHGPPDLQADEARIYEDMIDVIGKAFVGLTVACARCHDHKFDAITASDYYSLYGIIGSSRLDYADANSPARQEELAEGLEATRTAVRNALAELLESDMRSAREDLDAALAGRAKTPQQKRWATALGKKPNAELEALASLLGAGDAAGVERSVRTIRGRARDAASLGRPRALRTELEQWLTSGRAFGEAPRPPGDFVVTAEGDRAVASFVGGHPAAGVLTSRFGGAIRSPAFDVGERVSVRIKGKNVRVSLIIRSYELVGRGPTTGGLTKVINSESWQTVTFDTRLWIGLRACIEVLQNGGQFRFAATTADHVDGSWAAVGSASPDAARPPPRPSGRAALEAIDGVAELTPATIRDVVARRLGRLAARWRAGTLDTAESDLLDGLHEAGVLDFSLERSPALTAAVAAHRQLQATVPKPFYVRTLADGASEDEPISIRGSHKNPARSPTPRHFLDGVDGAPFHAKGSGRREWAEALVSPDNPLTARVMVNRIWHHLFGRGIVSSVDDFGRMGALPSDPQLLDYLARRFMRRGWSIKRLIRELVLSSAYRMSSRASPESLRVDPDNKLLQHMPIRRLQAESIRDTILSLGGALDRRLFGPSVGVNDRRRRSIYVQLRRRAMPPFLMLFDMPDATEPFGRRNVTSNPTQSLELLNGDLTWRSADAWARRIVASATTSFQERVQELHWSAFGRPATSREIEWARGLLADQGVDEKASAGHHELWRTICHTMLNRKELIYVY